MSRRATIEPDLLDAADAVLAELDDAIDALRGSQSTHREVRDALLSEAHERRWPRESTEDGRR